MLGASNDFYNFVIDSYHVFKKEDGTTLKAAWEMYKVYCDEAKVPYPYPQRIFKEELKNYFKDYKERFNFEDGSRVRSYYFGFKFERFEEQTVENKPEGKKYTIELKEQKSVFDSECSDCYAQYASAKETPLKKWSDVDTNLNEIDTSQLHYVKVPENHIVIDFDIQDSNGNKDVKKNIEEASKFPPTYTELSKSGGGVHLHYIYEGDVSKLSRVYDDRIEIKVFSGKSSLRRKLIKCNNLPIAKISSGLPLKGESNVINLDTVKNEKSLRTLIKKNLNKEIHANTKPSIDFIYKLLEDAYASGYNYDVTDMRNAVLSFAASSNHQASYCIRLVDKMQFKSEEQTNDKFDEDSTLIFYDVEVFPNLFLCNWKIEGEGKPVVRMINPTPKEIEDLLRFKLVGFNCRRYDNHILYARLIGYSNEQIYELSQKIVAGNTNCFFGEAYNLSYTDVYDFSSKKQSLKKFEIELGLHHQELGLPWDEPVPEKLWLKVAEYCDNDVIATEAVFNARKSDFLARKILADVAGLSVNDTTNTLTTKIIFGNNRKPQDRFNYRDMGKMPEESCGVEDSDDIYTAFDNEHRPLFPGYVYDCGKSTYRGEEVGEGGYVFSRPGMYGNIALLDVASMHPSSIVAENLFGDEYTKRFKDILDARVAIKHEKYEEAKKMLGGVLAKYLDNKDEAKGLAGALKIAINAVYGLTAAGFDNPFRDPRNKDNIVAKRGALFMINLRHEVEKRGYIVAHIKTDSIKIPDATREIIDFVMEYGKQYGYTFEHESTYDKFCLVNDAVYIAREKCSNPYYDTEGGVPDLKSTFLGDWTATGTQFAVPYVFKKLFTKEDIEFEDMCETKSVTSALYLDMNEELPDGEHCYIFVGKVGQFCPMKNGAGGGILLREAKTKDGEKGYAAATGTKGYRWMESEMVRQLGKEDDIDLSYYNRLVDDAVQAISQYGDFEWFTSEDMYVDDETNGIFPF
jgi:hypothetical protein